MLSQFNKADFDYYKIFAQNSIFMIISYLFIYARGIILLPLLIKNIGTTFYGGYVLLMMSIGFISAVSNLGAGFKFQRFIPSTAVAVEQRNLFYPQTIFQLISAFFVSAILIIFRRFIKEIFLKNQIDFSVPLIVSILLIYVLFSTSTNFFRYTHRMKLFTVAVTLHNYLIVLFMAVAVLVLHTKTINPLLLSYLFALLFISIPLSFKIYKEIGFIPFTFRFRNIFEDIRLGFPLVLSYIVDFILSGSDKYIIAILISTAAVGHYSPAYTLGSLIIMLPKVCGGGALPPLLASATDRDKKKEAKVLVDYSIKLFLIIAFPFVLGSLVLSKPLLMVLANKEVAESAYLVTPIVALGTLFYGLNLILSQVLFVSLKTKTIFNINAISALLNLILNLIFIYIFRDILLAAVTTLLSYFVSFVILNKRVKSYVYIEYDFKLVLKYFTSSLIMAIFVYCGQLYFRHNLLSTVSMILGSAIIYFLLLIIFRAFKEEEIRFVRNLLIKG